MIPLEKETRNNKPNGRIINMSKRIHDYKHLQTIWEEDQLEKGHLFYKNEFFGGLPHAAVWIFVNSFQLEVGICDLQGLCPKTEQNLY